MQQENENKIEIFNKALGELVQEYREKYTKKSIREFSYEYGFDRGNFSKLERGLLGSRFVAIWKIAEACQIKPSQFVKDLEKKLGENFFFFD